MAAGETMGRSGATVVEGAGRLILDQGLDAGRSGFDPEAQVWTAEHAAELLECFVNRPDLSGASFDEKLARQLAGASDGAIALFGELYFLSLLPLRDYKGSTKRDRINFALSRAKTLVHIPRQLDEALDAGVLNGGVAFKTRRDKQLAFLIEFANGFLALQPAERHAIMSDPIMFRDTVNSVTAVNAPSQRHTLNYLAFPKFFLPIAKTQHRTMIRDAFLDRIEDGGIDLDVDLHKINDALEAEAQGPVDYYRAPWRAIWDADAVPTPSDPWSAFLYWMQRFVDVIDLETEERQYKVKAARAIDASMQLAASGDTAWADAFRKATNVNLLPTYFKIALRDDLNTRPDFLRQAFLGVWEGEPDTGSLDDLQSMLKTSSTATQYTPGNITALASLLLMARDLAQYPPYRPTPLATAARLTKTELATGSPSLRYNCLLGMCDQLIERAADQGLEVQDRLDAQCLIWMVAQYPPPPEWSDAERIDFQHWRGDASPPDDQTPRRAWLIRTLSEHGGLLPEQCLEQEVVALPARTLREVNNLVSLDELRQIVEEDFSQSSYASRAGKVEEFFAFLTRMQLGDLAIVTHGERMYLGTVLSGARYTSGQDGKPLLVREVRWDLANGIPLRGLPADISARFQIQEQVVEMTQQLQYLESLLAAPEPSPGFELVLPDATAELASELHMPIEWLQESIELLRERRQLIYYGPPGTGKTYIARRLAKHLAGDNVRLVQFHPSYTYEDFFEGYRPVASGAFELRPGPMRKVVDKARENPTTPYFLIIDEINRGNLAKVFGELYFLLEYRDQQIDLLYASDDNVGFTLPRNVFIIGTMNTTDRSIALVDSAMRRRFAFASLHPASEPTAGLLRRWLKATHQPQLLADLLHALNEVIDDPEFKIGPSYFMQKDGHESAMLERIWKSSILPLLEDHHYGELTAADVAERYGLALLLSRLSKTAADTAEATHADADFATRTHAD